MTNALLTSLEAWSSVTVLLTVFTDWTEMFTRKFGVGVEAL